MIEQGDNLFVRSNIIINLPTRASRKDWTHLLRKSDVVDLLSVLDGRLDAFTLKPENGKKSSRHHSTFSLLTLCGFKSL